MFFQHDRSFYDTNAPSPGEDQTYASNAVSRTGSHMFIRHELPSNPSIQDAKNWVDEIQL